MSTWGTVELVTGGFTLAAFSIAAVLAAYRARLSATAKELLTLPKDERARALEVQREFFHIDASGLTRLQLEAVILEQIRARARRFLIGAILIGFLALILAALTAYALWIDQKRVGPGSVTVPGSDSTILLPTPAVRQESPKQSPSAQSPQSTAQTANTGQCPGDVLTGYQDPPGQASWQWTLNSTNGTVRIWKPDSSVRGRVTMRCDDGRWTASLREMDHRMDYDCSGRVQSDRIENASCNGNIPVRGTFTSSVLQR